MTSSTRHRYARAQPVARSASTPRRHRGNPLMRSSGSPCSNHPMRSPRARPALSRPDQRSTDPGQDMSRMAVRPTRRPGALSASTSRAAVARTAPCKEELRLTSLRVVARPPHTARPARGPRGTARRRPTCRAGRGSTAGRTTPVARTPDRRMPRARASTRRPAPCRRARSRPSTTSSRTSGATTSRSQAVVRR